jgi:hypothetical protein
MSKAITERRLKLRGDLFPKLTGTDFWSRQKSDGFTTIPRTMPIILAVIDSLTKSAPAGSTYFDLWCRAFDEHLIDLKNDQEMATSAGFSGERAVYTWRRRMESLRETGFIQTVGESRMIHAVLINPYKVLKQLRDRKPSHIPNDLWTALLSRMSEIGADDFDQLRAEEAARNEKLKSKKGN